VLRGHHFYHCSNDPAIQQRLKDTGWPPSQPMSAERVARIERETPSYHGVSIELPASQRER